MANYFIEIANDSREWQVTNSGISQSFRFMILLDGDPDTDDPYDGTIEDAEPDYNFLNASDDVVALKYAYESTPLFRYAPNYGLDKKVLVLKDISLSQVQRRQWEVTAQYSYDINQGSGGQRPDPDDNKNRLPFMRMQFSIGGGTKRITKSDETSNVVVADGINWFDDAVAALDDEIRAGAIGITEDSYEGTDVPSADLRVQITLYFLPNYVTIDFMKQIRDVIAGSTNKGSYNDKEFLGCEEGEVQLRGASGGGIVVDVIPITFDFAIGKNIVDEPDEGFPNLQNVKAWQLIDYIFLRNFTPGMKRMMLTPSIRVIHTIAQPADYDKLELPDDDKLSP